MRIVRMRVSAAVFALVCLGAHSQTISYFNQGFLRQPDAASDRRYLAIYGSNIVGVVLLDGTNILTGTNNFLGALLQNGVPVCTNCPFPSPYVLKSGDTMTGPLVIRDNAVSEQMHVYGGIFIHTNNMALAQISMFDDTELETILMLGGSGSITASNLVLKGSLSVAGGKSGIDSSGIHWGNGSGLTNVPTVGLTTTQYLSDFVIGPITNVYSNGLLVVSGVYFNVILGEDGIDMLGEDGSGIISE